MKLLSDETVDRNRKAHFRLCRSLQIQANAIHVPLNLIVVGGSALLASMGHEFLSQLHVWAEGNMFYRFAASFGGEKDCYRDGHFIVDIWSPSGEIHIHGGNWLEGGVDFSGFDGTLEIEGLRHWDIEKTQQWALAQTGEA